MEATIDRARGGDRDALGELWRAHQHLLLRYFRGRGASAPEDLASQVWLDVAEGLRRFEGDATDFKRWLFTIARRRHIDAIRRDTRRPDGAHSDAVGEVADHHAEDELEASDSLEQALALVRRLPADMAEVVLLRVVVDLSVTEVAAITGRSEANVRVLAHRGLQRLREKVVTQASSESMKER